MTNYNEGDTVEVTFEGSYRSQEHTLTGEVRAVTDDGLIMVDDEHGRYHEVFTPDWDDEGRSLVRSADSESRLGTRHGTTRGQLVDVAVVATDGGTTVEVGGEYDAMGERVEITNERDGRLCVHHPERDAVEGTAYTVWRPRESVEVVADREDWERLDEAADADNGDHEAMGEFVETPTCPVCGRFMRTWHESTGMPIATCSREGCETALDARELIDRGCYEE